MAGTSIFHQGLQGTYTGATEGNIHTVNSTGWATGATICKPSKHIMSSCEWQGQQKRWRFATTQERV